MRKNHFAAKCERAGHGGKPIEVIPLRHKILKSEALRTGRTECPVFGEPE